MMLSADELQQCWFLAGPTASGKSSVALELAQRLPCEILAMDSMTIYRGMDIGTAKPSMTEQAKVPHHLLDICEPDQEFSVVDYLAAAATAVRGVLARKRIPLFVGGSGLYLRSLLRGIFSSPPADAVLRARLNAERDAVGALAFHARLHEVDPVAAQKLSPNDARRVVRALEIWESTGRPWSSQQEQRPLPHTERPRHVYWLSPPRQWLHDRINQRVLEMMAAGWVSEVRQLAAAPESLSSTARQALGYQELLTWLEHEQESLADVVVRIQTRTRQFAKRQHTWFRHLEECHAVELPPDSPADAIATQLLSRR